MKEQLLQVLLAESDNSVRKILVESIGVFAEFDYPDRFVVQLVLWIR